MSYARGKYGVEYTRRPSDEKSGGRRWMLVVLGVLLVVSFTLPRLLSHKKPARINEPQPDAESARGKIRPVAVPAPRVPTPEPRATTSTKPRPLPVKSASPPKSTRDMAWLFENLNRRPAPERVLLEKLAAAERQGEVVVAIDTIKRLCDCPAVADLHPRLFTRLGQLNMQLLFSERSSPWTARVVVKKGDSRDRLARNSHTTGAVLDRLNPDTNWARIRPDDVVRVLQFVKAELVVHKEGGFADLLFKGSFFRRFAFSGSVHVPAGDYPVTREPGKTAHAILRDLGAGFSPEDRADLEMFLAPESTITVSDK
jgi:hypothetical protein